MRLLTSLALLGLAALSAGGLPTPAEGILIASGAGQGPLPLVVALLAAWAGYAAGDALWFWLLRSGVVRRLPARWRARLDRSAVRRIGVRTVFLSRLVPGSAVVTAAASASPISTRRFLAAAVPGELIFAAGVLGVGLGGGALITI